MKHGRVGLTLLTAAALLASFLPPKALADSNARIVRLSYVDGDTQIDSRDGRGFAQAFLNMPLAPGTQVLTRADGRAEIEFEDMSTVRLTPDTLVETQSLDLRSSGGKYTLVDLQDGTAYFNVRKLQDDDDFRVTTGQREFSLTRASRFRLRVDHKQVVLAVFSGEVEVTGESGRLTVRKNETLTLDLDDPARYFLAKGVAADRYDDWDQERDEYRDRYAKAGTYNGYVSAYSYGVSDLNYWGSYTYISGYGYMWRPNYYGLDWNPYANGAWYWYPGYGWIWVSAYPWGWMPFRYGNWYYISGHGWCWSPGHNWHHWRPLVAVHNPPPGHHGPTPPPSTGHHDPVVVGHGPATILPAEDRGPLRGVRTPNVLDKKSWKPAADSGSGGVSTSGSGTPAAGSGGNAGGGPVGSGRPAADSGGPPRGRGREVDLEQAIQDARERRLGGSQSGGAVTNSGPATSGALGGSSGPGSSGSGAASQDVSPAVGREKIPESRRQLPETITNDRPTPISGSVGGAGAVGSRSSSSDSGATSPAEDISPASRGVRSPEQRREPSSESFRQSSGSSGSSSSSAGSSNSGSTRSNAGWSGSSSAGSSSSSGASSSGSSGRSSSTSSSGSSSSSSGYSGGRSSVGSSGGSSGGSRSSSGSSSAGSRSSSSGSSSSSRSGSSTTSTPK